MARNNELIDWKEWGMLLRLARIRNGYSSAAALVAAVEEMTGLSLSARSIYALEEGQHVPSAEIYVALQLVLPEMHDPVRMRSIFKRDDIRAMFVEFK